MAEDDDDRDEDDRKARRQERERDRAERADRASAIAPEPLEPATLTIPISPPRADKKLRKDAIRPLDSWERYRALTDALDEAIDLVDLADHKARFAIVIMAAINVVLFFVAVRTDLVKEIPGFFQP